MRLRAHGPARARARARRRSVIAEQLRHPGDLDRRHLPGERRRRHTGWASRPSSYMDAGRARARRGHQRHGAGPAGRGRRRRRVPARRVPAHGAAGRGAGQDAGRAGRRPRRGARAGGRRRRGDPAAVRSAHLPGLRQDLARRVRRAGGRGHLRPLWRRALPARRRQGGDHRRAAARSTPGRPRRWSTSTARRACWSGIDATGPVEEVTVRAIGRATVVRADDEHDDVPPAANDSVQDAGPDRDDARARAWWWPRRSPRCGTPLRRGCPPAELDADRRGGDPGGRCQSPSFLGYHGLPGDDLRLGQRRGRARDPQPGRVLRDGDLISIDCGAIAGRLARRRGDHGRAWAGSSRELERLADGRRGGAVGRDRRRRPGTHLRPGPAHRHLPGGRGRGAQSGRYGIVDGLRRPRHRHRDAPGPARAQLRPPGQGTAPGAGLGARHRADDHAGSPRTVELADGWTVVTADGSVRRALGAHRGPDARTGLGADRAGRWRPAGAWPALGVSRPRR